MNADEKIYTRCVVDLETLATSPRAIVLEVGLVFLAPDLRMAKSYEWEVAAFDGGQADRVLDGDTLMWWAERLKNGHEIPGLRAGVPIGAMVDDFLTVWDRHATPDCEIWSQGTDFDVAILRDVLASYGYSEPWKHSLARDLRTAKAWGGWRRPDGRVVAHRALADAEAEAAELIALLERRAG